MPRPWSIAGLLAAGAVLVAAGAVARTDENGPPKERGTLRVAVASRIGEPGTLSPLLYWGGFETKTVCFEPLVGVAPDGAPAPALAESWECSDDGRTWTFTLRAGIVCHDGASLDASGVRDHLIRWRGNPAHRWLGTTDRMERIEALDARRVRVTLSEPWCLLAELAAVNPAHVVAPGAWNSRGEMKASVGTGPFRVVSQVPTERIVLESHDGWWGGVPGVARIELIPLPTRERESEEALRALLRGDVDLVADGETSRIVRDQLEEIAGDPRWRVWSNPGSCVHHLIFNLERPPFSDVELRRIAAAAVDRPELIRDGELGHAEPATSMFRAPGAGWPAEGASVRPAVARVQPGTSAVLLLPPAPPRRLRRHGALLAGQLARAGIDVRVEVPASAAEYAARRESRDFDIVFGSTQGIPYDPWIAIQALFLGEPATAGRTASSTPPLWADDAMAQAVRAALSATDDEARRRAFVAAQARLDEMVPLVPLFVPRRLAVARADVEDVHIAENGYDFGLWRVRRSAK